MMTLEKQVLEDGSGNVAEFLATSNALWADAIGERIVGGNPSVQPDVEEGAAELAAKYFYMFDAASEESLYFKVQLNHDIDLDAPNVYPHVHWFPDADGDGVDDVVRWGLDYCWMPIGEVASANANAVEDSDIIDVGDQNKHFVADFGPIAVPAGLTLSTIMVCRVYRDATATEDKYPNDAGLLYFDIHYQRNNLGSRQEYAK